MPLVPIAIAFVVGAAAGGYVMTNTTKLLTVGAVGAGAYYLIKKGV